MPRWPCDTLSSTCVPRLRMALSNAAQSMASAKRCSRREKSSVSLISTNPKVCFRYWIWWWKTLWRTRWVGDRSPARFEFIPIPFSKALWGPRGWKTPLICEAPGQTISVSNPASALAGIARRLVGRRMVAADRVGPTASRSTSRSSRIILLPVKVAPADLLPVHLVARFAGG